MLSSSQRRGDSFCLTDANGIAFVFSDERKKLEHKISDKRAKQIFALPRVEQGHVEHNDIDALFLGEQTPLFLNLTVVASQSVDGVNDKYVSCFEACDKALVVRAFKIFARLFVNEHAFCVDVSGAYGFALAGFVLIDCRDADVAVSFQDNRSLA